MVKVLLVLIAAVSWYLAGVFHSFAIMLYAVCLAVFMLVMHIITRIYKKKITFSFETEYICAAKDIECPVAINIKNNIGDWFNKINDLNNCYFVFGVVYSFIILIKFITAS